MTLLAAARDLAPVIAARAAEIEAARRIVASSSASLISRISAISGCRSRRMATA